MEEGLKQTKTNKSKTSLKTHSNPQTPILYKKHVPPLVVSHKSILVLVTKTK